MSARCSLVLALSLSLGSVVAGCEPELGECDAPAALRVAYDPDGLAVFEGQAQLIASCGAGAFCHADGIEPAARFGVPAGLEFDVRLAAPDGRVERSEIERLRRAQFRSVLHRHAIWGQVERGSMPPGGSAGAAALEVAPAYVHVDAESGELVPLPGLDSEAGRDQLRNWLACGAPVVERPVPRDDGLASEGHVIAGLDLSPPEPVWSELYPQVVAPRCASAACHGAAREAGLDLRGEAASLTLLLASEASAEASCSGEGALVVPGDADASLLVRKLEGTSGCGVRMPIGSPLPPSTVAAFRTWVEAGAPE